MSTKPSLDFSPPASSISAHFQASWIQSLISDPALRAYNSPNLSVKPNRSDTFIAETLSSNGCIAAWQSFYLAKPHQPAQASTIAAVAATPRPSPRPLIEGEEILNGEFLTFLALGEGMNGQPSMLHGGAMCFMFDECMRLAVMYTLLSEIPGDEVGWREKANGFTASLTTQFRRPVVTPGVVLVRVWIERRVGRKVWCRGVMLGGADGRVVVGDAEALFLVGRKEVVVVAKL